MLGDIIVMLAEEPRLEIVARVGPLANLDEAVSESGAEVVLMSGRVKRTLRCAEFIRRHPTVRLLALSNHGERLRVCTAESSVAELRNPSPRQLIAVILGQ